MSTNEKETKKADVTNDGTQMTMENGEVVFTKPAKEHKLLGKVKMLGARTFEWVKAHPMKMLGIAALATGAVYGGKELYDRGRKVGYAEGVDSVVHIQTEEVPAIEETTDDPELEALEEMETEEVVG